MATLQCYLLGPPRFACDKRALKIQRHKAQALLVYLVVTRRAQARATLAALLWPEHDSSQALAALRRHLSELKSALGSGWIETDHETIQCAPDAAIWLDIDDFAQQLATCATHSHAPEAVCPACIAPLTAAVVRYSNDFLAGFTLPDAPAFDEWQFFQREALHQQLTGALYRLVQAHVANHEPALAIPHARRRLSLDPLDEAAHRQLMTLYAATGQQAAALRQYDECLRLLEVELGVPPEEETTTLCAQIRRGGTSMGPRELTELPAAQQNARHNLPAQTTPFVGREEEITTLLRLCRDPAQRLVTILGPGGIGKTRLAIAVASQLIGDLPHGVFLVRLAQLGDPAHIVPAMADALNFHFHADGRSAQQQLFDYLSRRELLLILDNIEHLLAGVDLVQALLEHCPRLQLLVTSRERLQLMGETVFTLGSMDFPTWEIPEDTRQYSAIQLFLQTAQRIAPGRQFCLDETQYIARICRLVSGNPLGIILAATWVEVLDPAAIAAELTHSFDLLETELRDLPARQRSMRTVLAYSWHRLDEHERNAFARLTVFRGGFTRDAAQLVAGATLPILARLVDKSFVQSMADGRYTIHELLRQYGEQQLADAGETRATQTTHSAYYLAFLHECKSTLAGPDQLTAITELEADFENIRTAWQWAVQDRQYALVDRALDGLFRWFWLRRSRQHEGLALLDYAEQQWTPSPGQKPHSVWGRILARSVEQQGPWLLHGANIQKRVEQALAIAHDNNNNAAVAFCTWALGLAIISQRRDTPFANRLHPIAVLYAKSLDYFRDHDRFWYAQILEHLGHCFRIMGEFAKADAALQESLAIRRCFNDRFGMARCWRELGFVAYIQGLDRETEHAWQTAYTIQQELGDQQGIADSQFFLCVLAIIRGDWQSAQHIASHVMTLANDMHNLLYIQWATRALEISSCMEEYTTAATRGTIFVADGVNVVSARRSFLLFSDSLPARLSHLYMSLTLARTDIESAICLPFAVRIFVERGEHLQAVKLLALFFRYPIVADGWVGKLPEVTMLRAQLQAALPGSIFAHAWQEGQQMDLHHTIEDLQAMLSAALQADFSSNPGSR